MTGLIHSRWRRTSAVSYCTLVLIATVCFNISFGSTREADAQPPVATRSPQRNVTGSNQHLRKTNDRDHDLIVELIARREFDIATTICERMLADADPRGDEAAKWAIRWSRTQVARFQTQQVFGDPEIAMAAKHVQELLKRYPTHRRALFLRSQQITGARGGSAKRDRERIRCSGELTIASGNSRNHLGDRI